MCCMPDSNRSGNSWISVNSHLPNYHVRVLVYSETYNMRLIAERAKDKRFWIWEERAGQWWNSTRNSEWHIHGITHWQYLPENPLRS